MIILHPVTPKSVTVNTGCKRGANISNKLSCVWICTDEVQQIMHHKYSSLLAFKFCQTFYKILDFTGQYLEIADVTMNMCQLLPVTIATSHSLTLPPPITHESMTAEMWSNESNYSSVYHNLLVILLEWLLCYYREVLNKQLSEAVPHYRPGNVKISALCAFFKLYFHSLIKSTVLLIKA